MRFIHLNQPPNEYDYHVARVDVSVEGNLHRVVAYGATLGEAESLVIDTLDKGADIVDMGSC